MDDESTDDGGPSPRWLTVHALSEFVFCPRAGILTVETAADNHAARPRANLDFSLPYTVEELEQGLNRHLNRLWLLGTATVVALVGAAVAAWTGREIWLLVAAVLVLLLARPVSLRVTAIQQLIRLRRAVAQHQPREPDFSEPVRQEVSWWELLAAGWMSVRCHEAYRDEELRLSGAPWRTLRRGSVTIPVFKLPNINTDDEPHVRPQDVVRMAGYSQLIETCEGRESPAGIVLFGDSYQGLALPNSPEAKQALLFVLQSARELLIEARETPNATSPPPTATCAGCRWGQPRRYRQDYSEIQQEGESVPVFGTVAPDRRLYHAPCGDLFGWVPPHELTLRLKIL